MYLMKVVSALKTFFRPFKYCISITFEITEAYLLAFNI